MRSSLAPWVMKIPLILLMLKPIGFLTKHLLWIYVIGKMVSVDGHVNLKVGGNGTIGYQQPNE